MTLTPCVSLCKIEDGKCLGCNRTKEQIAKWRSYTDQERYEIMKDLGYGKRKGGNLNEQILSQRVFESC